MYKNKVLSGINWSAKIGDMKWLVATISGIAVLLPCLAMPQAQGAFVPDYGIPMPYYWSGINCRAIGNLYVLPPPNGGGRHSSLMPLF